jgi:hypothetical protein
MKYYVAGKITNNPKYQEQFEKAEEHLLGKGHYVMNPAVLPYGFDYEDYMKICFAMIDVCESIYCLANWYESPGAKREHQHAIETGKRIEYGGVEDG